MPHLNQVTFACIDCETTGLDLDEDRIIEIGLMLFTLHEDGVTFTSLIDPKKPISEVSFGIHHISDDMVKGQPPIEEILPRVLKLVKDYPIVGHGIAFDVNLIHEACKRANIPCHLAQNKLIDTLRLARLYGDCPINSLEMLRKHFNISEEGAHRAMNDVRVNVQVFRKLIAKFSTLEEIFKQLSKPIRLKLMPLGKHKGRPFKEIPLEYLRWAAAKEFDDDLLFSIRSEINNRTKAHDFRQCGNPFLTL